jgi:hypothetical protein
MPRRLSAIAPDWWDYTTLDRGIIEEAARLTPRDLLRLTRPGFRVVCVSWANWQLQTDNCADSQPKSNRVVPWAGASNALGRSS